MGVFQICIVSGNGNRSLRVESDQYKGWIMIQIPNCCWVSDARGRPGLPRSCGLHQHTQPNVANSRYESDKYICIITSI
jgi:hypothetical protein